MSAFVNPFVSGKYRRLVEGAIWLTLTVAMLAGGAAFWCLQIHDSLKAEAKAKLSHFDTLDASVTTAFDELQRMAPSAPCSEAFVRDMRRVAFKPDGLNEFMYAPGRMVTCSTSRSAEQARVPLGVPDVEPTERGGTAFWINRPLDDVGLIGEIGTIALREPFALVIPPQTAWSTRTSWVKTEHVLSLPDGRSWHLGGEEGIFAAASGLPGGSPAPFTALLARACGDGHTYCIAVKADIMEIAFRWRTELLLAIGLMAFYAIWPASVACRALERYWSLEQQFLRNLNTASIVCAYQPILDLKSGQISGCEVLARWRDVDGSVIYPDRFIDVVARSGRTLEFTKMVAERAFEELSRTLPPSTRIQVNFNIFPGDLNSKALHEAFMIFEREQERFQIALEIVESDDVRVEVAQREIEALGHLGIRTYIDDFGSGYSNIHRVASLSIDGVKLDRSFAMAPCDSLMARMLIPALDMVASAGREIVVEGVETKERLELLMGTTSVAYAQGYCISRPLSIEGLAEFLANHDANAILASRVKAAA